LGDALKDPKPLAKAALEFPSIDGDQKNDGDVADDIILREAENILADYIKLSANGTPFNLLTGRTLSPSGFQLNNGAILPL
jgi:hypothetical protein